MVYVHDVHLLLQGPRKGRMRPTGINAMEVFRRSWNTYQFACERSPPFRESIWILGKFSESRSYTTSDILHDFLKMADEFCAFPKFGEPRCHVVKKVLCATNQTLTIRVGRTLRHTFGETSISRPLSSKLVD